jgi:hypothetical protein
MNGIEDVSSAGVDPNVTLERFTALYDRRVTEVHNAKSCILG